MSPLGVVMNKDISDYKGYDGYEGDRSCDFTWKDALQDDITQLVYDVDIQDSYDKFYLKVATVVSAKWKENGYNPGQELNDIELEYLQERLDLL